MLLLKVKEELIYMKEKDIIISFQGIVIFPPIIIILLMLIK